MKLQVKALSPKIGTSIPFPYYATKGAAALDLHACIDAPVTILAGAQVVIPTGIAVAIPDHYVGIMAVRSSMGVRKGVSLANSIGGTASATAIIRATPIPSSRETGSHSCWWCR